MRVVADLEDLQDLEDLEDCTYVKSLEDSEDFQETFRRFRRFRRFSVMPKAICMYDDHGTPTILMTGTDFKTARGWRWRVKARRRLHLHFMVIGHPSGGLSTKATLFFKGFAFLKN